MPQRGGLSWLVLLFVIDLGFGHITLCVFHELCLSRLIAEAIGFAVDCGIDGVVGLTSLPSARPMVQSGRPASPFASCYRANFNRPSWSRQLNEQSALMRASAARPIGPDSVAQG